MPRGYRENGRPLPTDFLGGGENIRSKDFLNIGYWPENFLCALTLDGVFERFPRLRGASIEQGAEWVVTMLKKLDGVMQFARAEPDLKALPLPAADYIRRQVKFTPFPKDDVAWIIDQVGPDLLMFSTDMPHPEGHHRPAGPLPNPPGRCRRHDQAAVLRRQHARAARHLIALRRRGARLATAPHQRRRVGCGIPGMTPDPGDQLCSCTSALTCRCEPAQHDRTAVSRTPSALRLVEGHVGDGGQRVAVGREEGVVEVPLAALHDPPGVGELPEALDAVVTAHAALTGTPEAE